MSVLTPGLYEFTGDLTEEESQRVLVSPRALLHKELEGPTVGEGLGGRESEVDQGGWIGVVFYL